MSCRCVGFCAFEISMVCCVGFEFFLDKCGVACMVENKDIIYISIYSVKCKV